MSDRRDEPQPEMQLSDEVAQRLLARVIELDAQGHAATSVARLRDVTRELGIPDEIFDRALWELKSQRSATARQRDAELSSSVAQSWWRRLQRPASGRTVAEEALVNVGVFAAFFGALGLASRFTRLVGGDWPLHAGLFVAINVAAVALARRYRARPVMYALAVTAIAQAVEYAMHLTFGIRAVQGGPTHWAVMVATAVAMFGARLLRSSDDDGAAASPEAAPDSPPMSDSSRRHWWSMLRAPEAT
jgi:hypothetical protein